MNRYRLTFALILFYSSLQLAQDIPNSGFENWTDGNPDNWYAFNLPGIATPVTQSSVSYSGTSAVKMEVVNSALGILIPLLTSGENTLEGFAVNQRHGSLQGFYQLSPEGNDGLSVSVWMIKDRVIIGGGNFEAFNAVSVYTQFAVPIDYFNTEVPDTAVISFIVGGDSASVGSFALIDDLSWGPTVNVQDAGDITPENFEIKQNYPNPFNPGTTIEFSIPEELFVELKIYDILGKEVTTLVKDNYATGSYKVYFNGDNLSGGLYLARMKAGSFTKSLKMMLLK